MATGAQAAKVAITPSGRPEALFRATSADATAGKLANECMNMGYQVQEQTNTSVVCDIPATGMRSVLAQMLVGSGSQPRLVVKFSLVQIGDTTRVQGIIWLVGDRQVEFTSDDAYNSLIELLFGAGGDLPPGTTYPSSGVYMGVLGTFKSNGEAGELLVTQVAPRSPADDAGMKVGDRIERVNGSTFRSNNDLSKKQNSVRLGDRYPVVVRRDGAELTLTVEARERFSRGASVDSAKAQPAPKSATPAPQADAQQP